MPTKLLVKTPLTSDGLTPKIDDEGRVEYSETIIPLEARENILVLNAKLPPALQHKMSEIEVDEKGRPLKSAGTAASATETKPKGKGKSKGATIDNNASGGEGAGGDNNNGNETEQ